MRRAKAGQVQAGGEVRSLATLSESIIHFTFPIVLLMSQGRGKGSDYRKSSLKQFRVIITAKWKTIKNYKAKAKLA